jgi:hypothetical protein
MQSSNISGIPILLSVPRPFDTTGAEKPDSPGVKRQGLNLKEIPQRSRVTDRRYKVWASFAVMIPIARVESIGEITGSVVQP